MRDAGWCEALGGTFGTRRGAVAVNYSRGKRELPLQSAMCLHQRASDRMKKSGTAEMLFDWRFRLFDRQGDENVFLLIFALTNKRSFLK